MRITKGFIESLFLLGLIIACIGLVKSQTELEDEEWVSSVASSAVSSAASSMGSTTISKGSTSIVKSTSEASSSLRSSALSSVISSFGSSIVTLPVLATGHIINYEDVVKYEKITRPIDYSNLHEIAQ